LGIRRGELRQYLAALGQGWREDSTNADPAYLRNRVRGELMPLLQRDSNPAIVELLAGLAEIARGEQEFWDGRAAALWNACADVIAAGDAGSRERRFRFDRGRFATLSLAEQRRAIEHGLRQFMPLDSRHVDRARNALLNGENVSLPGGWDLCWLRGRVDLKRRLAGKAKGMSQKAQTHG
ncbi:MAG: hypothetical protein JO041_15500, partial [Acidobacteria bacterium]|nr:hypothetical protein [Acidobacteriota bacterium]